MINILIYSTLTIVLFVTMRALYQRFPITLFNPVLLCILTISTFLLLTQFEYKTYQQGTLPIHYLLEPAVVALAFPLFKQFHQIKPVFFALCFTSWLGVSLSTLSAFLICNMFASDDAIAASMAALSVTTPITLLISDFLGGIPAVAAIMVILIGVFGGVFGLHILHLCNVQSMQAKGIALGIACHAIGTSAAMEHHPVAGAFSSAAMTSTAVITALWVPVFYNLLDSVNFG
ncbi:LrgB family protein [Pseudoalteromonas sp. SCSIO 43201]|uniref:LrgB family protein n=1 Tax=Pseudoalteromonas sp. SCSIO 43201 TaxID=2822842 RepID=UPI0020762077|nr:LrgB family protein [Pseudoalteromonas sp. SCSIO 43201]USD27478.1 LrgB family protein [Pseudoalteromonas sp. SCSIO 43201]